MSCVICNEPRFWRIPFAHDSDIERWRAEAGDNAAYDWRLCCRCGNTYPSRQPNLAVLQQVWVTNRADERLAPEAREAAWSYRRAIAQTGAARSFRLFAPLMNRPGRFLDVGCGLGETVRLFGDKGWDAEGIDADPSTERFHREAGIRARIGQFEEVETASSYDLIQIAHAIYFITDPMAFIHKVRERLAPGGVFGVVLADLMANADPSLPSYAHTFFPTGSSMRYALALAGFEVVLSKKLSGSIYIAARQAVSPTLPHVSPATIRLLYQTKRLRYAVIGRPYLALRQAAKTLLKPFRH